MLEAGNSSFRLRESSDNVLRFATSACDLEAGDGSPLDEHARIRQVHLPGPRGWESVAGGGLRASRMWHGRGPRWREAVLVEWGDGLILLRR